MSKDKAILSKLLNQLIHSSEDGEADEVDKWDNKHKKPKIDDMPSDTDEERRELESTGTEDEDDEDEDSKKMKRFLAALKD